MKKQTFYILVLETILIICLSICDVQAQLSPGALAAQHSEIEGISNCTQCHELGEGPSQKKCLDCHKLVQSQLDNKKGYHYQEIILKDKNCFNCHRDHAGREYDLVYWPKGIDNFDHLLTGYSLRGKHAKTPCRDCHNPANIKAELQSVEAKVDLTSTFLGLGNQCLSCHFDQHREQLGDDCQKCHSQVEWKPPTKFSHDSTEFKLTGKHVKADCSKCHSPIVDETVHIASRKTYYKYLNLKYDNCTSCHKDIHENKFGSDCRHCHKTSGWRNIKSIDFDHTKTAFALIGRHQKVDCEKCHQKGQMTKKLKYKRCMDCHSDFHRKQFTHRGDQGECSSCHTVNGFVPAAFSTRDHEQTRFVLTGSHLAQPCIACHKQLSQVTSNNCLKYKFEERSCVACHDDKHNGQFASSNPVKICEQCHQTDSWKKLKFAHNKDSEYPLVGAHMKVACIGCHEKSKSDGKQYVRYRPVKHEQCVDCHKVNERLGELIG